ncbi:hypothetical protein, partial [Mammaliicoccus sciuri]|uniref:hypothetical protein n=1 Tax=Mammaliicoccus sciuri TaxID=1296 RepID=UPI00197F4FA3
PVFGSIIIFIGLQSLFSGRYFILSACKSCFRVGNFIYRPENLISGPIIFRIDPYFPLLDR